MKCPRCHRENTGKNKTCLYCGTPLRAEQKKPGSRLIAIPVAVCSACTVIIIVCSIILLGDKSSKIRDQISLGYRALREQNYEQAEVCFKQALEMGGEAPSPEAQVGLAEALQRQDRPEEARPYLQQAQVNPTPIPQAVVTHYNYVAEYVAMPTFTPTPTPGTFVDPAVQPVQASPTPGSPVGQDPNNDGTEPETEGSSDTPATPNPDSEYPAGPTVAPEDPTGSPINLQPAPGDGGDGSAVGIINEDEETKLLDWFETNGGGASGADNGVPGSSVAKTITDLNIDEHPELVVTRAENYQLKAELYTVEDGEVTQKGEIYSPQEFGSIITEKKYQGTQSCFVDESSVHILTNVIGEDDGTGLPQARTTLTTMSFGEGQDVSATELEMINGNDPEPIAGTLEESETNPNAEWLRSMAGELSAENSDPDGDLSQVSNPIEGGVASIGVNEELLFISAYKAPGEEVLHITTNESAGTAEPTETPEEETSEGETGTGTEANLEVITDEEPGTGTEDNPEVITDEEPGTEPEDPAEGATGEEPGTEPEENMEINPGEGPGTEPEEPVEENMGEEPNTEALNPTVETGWETFPAVNIETPGQTTDPTYTDNSTGQQPVEWVIDPDTGQPVDPVTGEPVDPMGGQSAPENMGQDPMQPVNPENPGQDPMQAANPENAGQDPMQAANPENAGQDPMQAANPENAGQTSTDETALLTQQAASFPATFTQMTGDAGTADGVIGTKIVDIAGSKKLVVVSIKSGAMMFDLYAVQNGQVVKAGSGSGQGAFGNASDMYNASQVVFSTSAGIGIASAHSGRTDGNMCTVNFRTVDPAGNIVPGVNASWNSGSDIGTFQEQLVPAGLNGSWAASLEQDGAPNPLSGGIGSAEPGTSDIAVATATGAAGNMTISAMLR